MSDDLELKDELEILNEEELKDELLEADLLMQEELDEQYEDEKDEDEDDYEDEKENINNSINYDESESELDVYFKYGTNNHKLDGKHSLKRDTILNGKVSETSETVEDMHTHGIEFDLYDTGDIPIERGSIFEEESRHGEDLQSKEN